MASDFSRRLRQLVRAWAKRARAQAIREANEAAIGWVWIAERRAIELTSAIDAAERHLLPTCEQATLEGM